jgi:putative tricarboxylic transport membrane protein
MSAIETLRKEGSVARGVETAFTVLWLVFSLFFIWQATQVSEPPRNIVIGPRTFPLLVGAMMLVVSIVLVWQRLRVLAADASAVAPDSGLAVVPLEEDETSISDWPGVWIALGSLLALFLLLERLGFVLSISLFLFGLSTFFGPRRWLLNLVTSLVFSSLFYYLFARVLGIPLPNGVLRFLL